MITGLQNAVHHWWIAKCSPELHLGLKSKEPVNKQSVRLICLRPVINWSIKPAWRHFLATVPKSNHCHTTQRVKKKKILYLRLFLIVLVFFLCPFYIYIALSPHPFFSGLTWGPVLLYFLPMLVTKGPVKSSCVPISTGDGSIRPYHGFLVFFGETASLHLVVWWVARTTKRWERLVKDALLFPDPKIEETVAANHGNGITIQTSWKSTRILRFFSLNKVYWSAKNVSGYTHSLHLNNQIVLQCSHDSCNSCHQWPLQPDSQGELMMSHHTPVYSFPGHTNLTIFQHLDVQICSATVLLTSSRCKSDGSSFNKRKKTHLLFWFGGVSTSSFFIWPLFSALPCLPSS